MLSSKYLSNFCLAPSFDSSCINAPNEKEYQIE